MIEVLCCAKYKMYFARSPIRRLLQFQMRSQSEFCHPLHMQVVHYLPVFNSVCVMLCLLRRNDSVVNQSASVSHIRTCTIVACMTLPALH